MNPPPQQPERRRRRGNPPTDLNDDALSEIFFRIPPGDPAVLVRLSAVCKSWRRLVTDPYFLRGYRAFHRAPPVLGFFCAEVGFAGFVPTTAFRPIIPSVNWLLCDSRHGRALFNAFVSPMRLLVSDPMTGAARLLDAPERWRNIHWSAPQHWMNIQWSAAVLCAVDGCDHLDCHGGAFRVALARRPSVLVGNALYFLCYNNTSIVEFDMATMTLSVIPSPPLPEDVYGALLMTAEGGGLGFAAVLERSNLHLWSKPKEEGTDEWEHLEDVRDLKTLLPVGAISMMNNLLIGFADGGVRVVVVRTYHGPSIVELGSTGPAKVMSRRIGVNAVFPYTSFCTPEIVLCICWF
uniref:F-box domain-containing protein n=1 Tax=Oryza punctata TaxID=4537 RepID=A0A0E0L9Y7_ORYPU